MSESDVIPPSQARTMSLDAAIECCLLELENNPDMDSSGLVKRFPQWSVEIAEFLENWTGMRRIASLMVDRSQEREVPDLLAADTRKFGDYELLERIGVGGMGVIYKARQISLDRIVALKMIIGDRQDNDRFRVEAESVAALAHPNIVSLYETGNYGKRLFFTMQLIEGCNLKEYLDQRSITPRQAAQITKTLAGAVHYAHQRGTLHRDLKPANIMMDADGQPHITDFGLAKRIERDCELTRSGTILGTPGYMAPEQATGKVKNLTTTTDVYGLGAILYAMLTGEAPFTGNSSLDILRRVVDEPPTSPRVRNPGIDRDIETICLKCLEKSPELRYASSELLANDLDRFLAHQPVKARPVSTSERTWRWCRRNPAISILSVVVVALLIATSISSFFLALSERNSRLAHEERLREKLQLITDVGIASVEKEEAKRNTRETLAKSFLSNGLSKSKAGMHGDALLWFTELARLMGENEQALRENLLRAQSWLGQQPVPVAARMLDGASQRIPFQKQHDKVQFRPGKIPQLLCISRAEISVWDFSENKHWNLMDDFPGVTAAAWSPDGDYLAVGCKDGKLELVDPDIHEVVQVVRLPKRPIEHLSFSNEGEVLAISSGTKVRLWEMATETFMGDELVLNSDVVALGFNRSGTQLSVVQRAEQTNVYRITDEIRLLYEVPCQIGRTNENQRAFWPTFVDNDDCLLTVSPNGRELQLYQAETGEPVGSDELVEVTFSVGVADDGMRIGTSSTTHAKLLRIGTDDRLSADDATSDSIVENPVRVELQQVTVMPHQDRVVSFDFGPNNMIATGGWDREVRVWRMDEDSNKNYDVPPRNQLLAVIPHQARTRQVELSPDGSWLATIQVDGLLRVWKIPDYKPAGYVVPVRKYGSSVRLAGRDSWIVAGDSSWRGQAENVSMHQWSDDKMIGSTPELSKAEHGQLLDSHVSPDGGQLATLHANPNRSKSSLSLKNGTAGTLRLWNWPDGTPNGEPIPMPSEPRSVAFHPTASQLAVCTAKMEIVLINTQSLSVETVLSTTDQAETAEARRALDPIYYDNGRLAYSPDGKVIVAWGDRDGVWVWDLERRQPKYPPIDNNGEFATSVEFSPDGSRIVIAGGRSTVARVVDLQTGNETCPALQHSAVVPVARFSPNGRQLITACRDGEARVFDLDSGEIVTRHLLHTAAIRQASFSNDARYIFTLGIDHRLRVWNVRDGSLALKPIPTPPWANQLLVSPDSRYVLIGTGRQAVAVFDFLELQQEPLTDLAQLKSVSELLAGKSIDNGEAVRLSSRSWFKKWQQYKARFVAR